MNTKASRNGHDGAEQLAPALGIRLFEKYDAVSHHSCRWIRKQKDEIGRSTQCWRLRPVSVDLAWSALEKRSDELNCPKEPTIPLPDVALLRLLAALAPLSLKG
jgi:hypothetical protein